MNPEANPMPLVSDCDPVDACECPCCSTVFRVRTLMTDGAGRLMRDEYETIPMFCPMCGGLAWWVNKGFYLTIWAGNLSDVYDTNIFHEFRHELIRRLADQYERKAREVRGTWAGLCGDDSPMPDNLVKKADGYSSQAEKLRDAIKDDGVPVFIDDFADFKLLRQHDPYDLLTGATGDRLRKMGLVERKYNRDQVFDELTDKGRAAIEYTERTMGISLK